MNSESKKMPLTGSSSSNAQIKSSENYRILYKRIDMLQDSISTLMQIVRTQNDSIITSLDEIKILTNELVRQETSVTSSTNCFPLASDAMLQDIEEKISAGEHATYVSIMSRLWRNCVGKNLESILDREIVMRYNIDGSHGKLALKKYKNFYKALINSIESLSSTGPRSAETLLRQAIQLCKKKQFRQKALIKKIKEEVEEVEEKYDSC